MCKKYRVVMTCWDPDNPKPYADDFSGIELSLFSTQELAQQSIETAIENELNCLNELETDNPRKKEPVYDSDSRIVCYDYPFRGDLYGEHDGIVRFWDGDDYQPVTAYNIHLLTCDSDDIGKCSYYKYRGFWIIPNEAHTSFKVEQYDTVLARFKKLKDALREIDNVMVDLSYGTHSHNKSINAIVQSASTRAAEAHSTNKTPVKESTPER